MTMKEIMFPKDPNVRRNGGIIFIRLSVAYDVIIELLVVVLEFIFKTCLLKL